MIAARMSDRSEKAGSLDASEEVSRESLTEAEIMEERRELEAVIIGLRAQLEHDKNFPRHDPTWRTRANAKLRHTIADRDMLGNELRRRDNRAARQLAALNPKALALGAERERQKAEQQRQKAEQAAQKTARTQLYESKRQQREVMFVIAAGKILPGEQIRAIWEKAQELFPDDPSWTAAVKIPDETRSAIRAAYSAGEGGYKTLAKRFGVPTQSARNAVRDLRNPASGSQEGGAGEE